MFSLFYKIQQNACKLLKFEGRRENYDTINLNRRQSMLQNVRIMIKNIIKRNEQVFPNLSKWIVNVNNLSSFKLNMNNLIKLLIHKIC